MNDWRVRIPGANYGAVVIVRLDKWSKNSSITRFCDRLLAFEGTERRSTPQRCLITHSGQTLAAIGLESGKAVIEFRPDKDDYADAHGSAFVRPHPLQQMARDGWLQGHPETDADLESIITWVESAIDPAEHSKN